MFVKILEGDFENYENDVLKKNKIFILKINCSSF